MRSVQGYRPFMRWKGSVVDSVVGVFLTQSASDSSSSSAFMYLAAKYPNQITTGDHTEHAIDWNAVRTAQHSEISNAIEERGMKNKIAQRIQEFLHRIHDDKTGLIDLEWLRSATAEEARHYFMEVYGLGLKSTECLRLLTLRQRAFPVDRHVCRIAVRLGWVPIKKLPDGVLLHQLKEYPNTDHVQEYLSRRLSVLDVDTLYVILSHD
ncbi:putative HhH-GPD domain, DNA glycosylase [Helianthus annuus]|uniref:HhH-GPD domain, DNA glycosylase n=1 Tax=Helianthus annuus TaxID=4232 RepID=A0A9K3GY88_HELAN|nr:putative HhH-GPD domain, DNA glycosylase [Helianthus annuus]